MGNIKNEECIGDEDDAKTENNPLEQDHNNKNNDFVSSIRVKVNGGRGRMGGVIDDDDDSQSVLPIKIPIIGFETMEERARFTIFKLRVESHTLDDSWLVFRRYTDFVRLHSKLKEEIPDVEISIPPKRWLRDNFETLFLEERMKGLQAMIDEIILQPELVTLQTVRKFFCLDEPPVYSDTSDETKSWCGIIEDSSVMLRSIIHEKEQEVELLRAELALVTTQKDNLVKIARNCRNCCQKQLVLQSLTSPSAFNFCTSTPNQRSISTIMPSSSCSSSEHGNGSPRHRASLPPYVNANNSTTLHSSKHRKSSTTSRSSSIHSDSESPSHSRKEKHLSNGSSGNEAMKEEPISQSK